MGTTKGVRVASGNLCEAEAPTEATAETKPETTEENTMNAKTERQIENLKKQTIGVEIEMNHITRERAAKLAADHFGTGRYEYTASRNGYSTWSAWDAQGREWKFQKDVSIAGCDAEKCELVTPILKYEDIETLQELVRKLRKAGAISHAGIGAGVHIHIGANGHTPQTLRNLANLMASHERLIADALKIDQGRMNRYCRTVNPQFIEQLNRKKPTNMAQFESSNDFYGVKIPFTTKSFILTYDGTVKAGVDLDGAEVSVSGTTVTITLPEAEILSHEIDEDSMEVFDEKTSIFNPFTVEDFTSFQSDQKAAMEEKALSRGLLAEARAKAVSSVEQLFAAALPDTYTVTVQ